MSFVAFGLSHRTAPLAVLERVSVGPAERSKLLRQLCADDAVDGAVVLSTCNRIEVYLDAGRFHDAYRVARDSLADGAGLHPDEIAPHLALSYDTDTVKHLFSVAAGLDSARAGRARDPRPGARRLGGGPPRGRAHPRPRPAVPPGGGGRQAGAHRHVHRSGHRITRPGRGGARRPPARRAWPGAGPPCSVPAPSAPPWRAPWPARGVADLAVVNRGAERAEAVAGAVGARPVGLEGLGRELLDADVVVTASAAPGVVVELELVERILAERGGRPIVLVDAGLPRNVDPGGGLAGRRHPAGPRRRPRPTPRRGWPSGPVPPTPPATGRGGGRPPPGRAGRPPGRPDRRRRCAAGRRTCGGPRSSATGAGCRA